MLIDGRRGSPAYTTSGPKEPTGAPTLVNVLEVRIPLAPITIGSRDLHNMDYG
jgi:hypothetical protein